VNLTAENIMIVSATVVALTQLIKWSGLPDRYGPWSVLGISLLGVLMFQFSMAPDDHVFTRTDIWPVFSGWIVVATSAAGVFGFTRTAPEAITRTKPPPPGAGQSPTEKMG